MTAVRFEIPYPRTKAGKAAWAKEYGLNAYWAGKHWAKRKQDAEYWHALVRAELQRQGIRAGWSKQPYGLEGGSIPETAGKGQATDAEEGIRPGILHCPVRITFWWDDRLDIDNHAAMGKMIVDALKGYLLQDDGRRYLTGVAHRYHTADHILVEIEGVDDR